VGEPWGLGLGTAIVLGALIGLPALILLPAIVVAAQVIRGRRNAGFVLLIVAFVALGTGRAAMQDVPAAPPDMAESIGAQLEVQSLPRTSTGGDSALVSVSQFVFDSATRPGDGMIVLAWLPDGERAAPGDTLEVQWDIRPLGVIDPGYGSYVESRGAVADAQISRILHQREDSAVLHRLVDLRHHISEGLQGVLPGDAGALASGIVTGDDSSLSYDARQAFLRTGTSHITAVSGANVAMILAIWNLVIPAGRNRRLIAVQAVIIVSIWLYAVLVGLEPPAFRAAIMATLILLAGRSGRRPDLLTLLAMTSAAMVLWDPGYVHAVGFWLSVVATGAIIMRVPNAPGTGWRPMLRGMLEGVALAQIATLPVVLMTFGTWSLTSILANAILVPLVWLAFPLCFILAAIVVVMPWIAPVAALAPLIPLEVALQIVRMLGSAMPPLDFKNSGLAGVVAIALPCAIGLALLSTETQRWGSIVTRQWQVRPVAMGVVLIGPFVGLLAGLLVALMRA